MAKDGFEVNGINDVMDLVSAYTESLRTMKPLFDKIEEELDNTVNDSLQNQKSATTGRAFKPLTETTQVLEGKAPNTALQSKSGYARATQMSVSKDGATINVSIPHAGVHQFGNPKNKLFGKSKAPIPARQFLPIKQDGSFTERFQDKIEEMTRAWLEEQVAKRRRR